MARDTIKIEGLTQFSKAIKQIDADLPKTLRIGFNDAANIIVETARPRVARRSGRAARTIKARSTRTAVRIVAGGRTAPYFPWLDFGGRVGRNRSVHRPFFTDGRYVWKAFAERRADVQAALEKALTDSAKSAGFEVS